MVTGWHGFSSSNALSNRGKLQYAIQSEGQVLGSFYYLDLIRGEWKTVPRKRTCFADPGITWKERNDISRALIFWPPPCWCTFSNAGRLYGCLEFIKLIFHIHI